MKWSLSHAVAATLAYADLFEYPLTRKEVYHWLITDSSHESYRKISALAEKYPSTQFFSAYTHLQLNIKKRERREQNYLIKWPIALSVARLLSIIPSIELIGLSGGLAMHNADENDDIDFFFIVKPGTLWISRLFILSILQLKGRRRKANDIETGNQICPNMYLDLNHLRIPIPEQDLYSAHEVLQLVPIFERNNCYKKFLTANDWTKRYLANAWKEKSSKHLVASSKGKKIFLLSKIAYYLLLNTFYILEVPAKWFQKWYMRKHLTTEIISDSILRFHPRDTRVFIRQNYLKKLKNNNIPLDSRFFYSLQ